jgi:hypothetical protein
VPPKFVAILEDHPARAAAMRRALADVLPQFNTIIFDHAGEMRRWLSAGNFLHVVLISLDHDLIAPPGQDAGCGRDVADYLAERPCVCPVIVHTSNVHAAPGMMHVLRGSEWVCSFVSPRDDLAWIAAEWRDEVEQYLRRGLIFA